MSDKEEIRNLVEKYADAVCRRDEADCRLHGMIMPYGTLEVFLRLKVRRLL